MQTLTTLEFYNTEVTRNLITKSRKRFRQFELMQKQST